MSTALVCAAATSGAHMNPVITLAFVSRGKIGRSDAVWYVAFQLLGAIVAPYLVLLMIGDAFRHDRVRMASATPGPAGPVAALTAEAAITFVLVLTVLVLSDPRRLRTALPVVVGLLKGALIALESPISGMSMNPARTIGSAIASGRWDGWWLYVVPPTLGALSAVAAYTCCAASERCRGSKRVRPTR